MGSSSSRDECGYWAGFVPRLQMMSVRRGDMKRLVVPVKAVSTCGLTAGDTVCFRDCLSRSHLIVIQYQDGQFYLGSGWSRMLKKIDCSIGDQLLIKYKGGRTWKIVVFAPSTGAEKFPLRAAPIAGASTAESSNEVTHTHVRYGGHASPSTANEPVAPGYAAGEGTMEHPIVLDVPMEVVFNATGREISPAMAEFFDNLASTFELRVPLYYCALDSLHISCDFIALPMEYGKTYLLPVFEQEGYPKKVTLSINGGDESTTMRLTATSDGSVVLAGGWSSFLEAHAIFEGATLVFRFQFYAGDVIVHLYDF